MDTQAPVMVLTTTSLLEPFPDLEEQDKKVKIDLDSIDDPPEQMVYEWNNDVTSFLLLKNFIKDVNEDSMAEIHEVSDDDVQEVPVDVDKVNVGKVHKPHEDDVHKISADNIHKILVNNVHKMSIDDVHETAENNVHEISEEDDNKILVSFGYHVPVHNCETFLKLTMQEYVKSLSEKVRYIDDIDQVRPLMIDHLEYFYSIKSEQEEFEHSDVYFKDMENIMTFYVNMELRTLLLIKKKKKRQETIKKLFETLTEMLKKYLFSEERYVLNVLLKQTTNVNNDKILCRDIGEILNSMSCRSLLKLLYIHFLTTIPLKDMSDIGFCRGYILFQNWKVLESETSRKNIDMCIEKIYGRTFKDVQKNLVLNDILSTADGDEGSFEAITLSISKHFEYHEPDGNPLSERSKKILEEMNPKEKPTNAIEDFDVKIEEPVIDCVEVPSESEDEGEVRLISETYRENGRRVTKQYHESDEELEIVKPSIVVEREPSCMSYLQEIGEEFAKSRVGRPPPPLLLPIRSTPIIVDTDDILICESDDEEVVRQKNEANNNISDLDVDLEKCIIETAKSLGLHDSLGLSDKDESDADISQKGEAEINTNHEKQVIGRPNSSCQKNNPRLADLESVGVPVEKSTEEDDLKVKSMIDSTATVKKSSELLETIRPVRKQEESVAESSNEIVQHDQTDSETLPVVGKTKTFYSGRDILKNCPNSYIVAMSPRSGSDDEGPIEMHAGRGFDAPNPVDVSFDMKSFPTPSPEHSNESEDGSAPTRTLYAGALEIDSASDHRIAISADHRVDTYSDHRVDSSEPNSRLQQKLKKYLKIGEESTNLESSDTSDDEGMETGSAMPIMYAEVVQNPEEVEKILNKSVVVFEKDGCQVLATADDLNGVGGANESQSTDVSVQNQSPSLEIDQYLTTDEHTRSEHGNEVAPEVYVEYENDIIYEDVPSKDVESEELNEPSTSKSKYLKSKNLIKRTDGIREVLDRAHATKKSKIIITVRRDTTPIDNDLSGQVKGTPKITDESCGTNESIKSETVSLATDCSSHCIETSEVTGESSNKIISVNHDILYSVGLISNDCTKNSSVVVDDVRTKENSSKIISKSDIPTPSENHRVDDIVQPRNASNEASITKKSVKDLSLERDISLVGKSRTKGLNKMSDDVGKKEKLGVLVSNSDILSLTENHRVKDISEQSIPSLTEDRRVNDVRKQFTSSLTKDCRANDVREQSIPSIANNQRVIRKQSPSLTDNRRFDSNTDQSKASLSENHGVTDIKEQSILSLTGNHGVNDITEQSVPSVTENHRAFDIRERSISSLTEKERVNSTTEHSKSSLTDSRERSRLSLTGNNRTPDITERSIPSLTENHRVTSNTELTENYRVTNSREQSIPSLTGNNRPTDIRERSIPSLTENHRVAQSKESSELGTIKTSIKLTSHQHDILQGGKNNTESSVHISVDSDSRPTENHRSNDAKDQSEATDDLSTRRKYDTRKRKSSSEKRLLYSSSLSNVDVSNTSERQPKSRRRMIEDPDDRATVEVETPDVSSSVLHSRSESGSKDRCDSIDQFCSKDQSGLKDRSILFQSSSSVRLFDPKPDGNERLFVDSTVRGETSLTSSPGSDTPSPAFISNLNGLKEELTSIEEMMRGPVGSCSRSHTKVVEFARQFIPDRIASASAVCSQPVPSCSYRGHDSTRHSIAAPSATTQAPSTTAPAPTRRKSTTTEKETVTIVPITNNIKSILKKPSGDKNKRRSSVSERRRIGFNNTRDICCACPRSMKPLSYIQDPEYFSDPMPPMLAIGECRIRADSLAANRLTVDDLERQPVVPVKRLKQSEIFIWCQVTAVKRKQRELSEMRANLVQERKRLENRSYSGIKAAGPKTVTWALPELRGEEPPYENGTNRRTHEESGSSNAYNSHRTQGSVIAEISGKKSTKRKEALHHPIDTGQIKPRKRGRTRKY